MTRKTDYSKFNIFEIIGRPLFLLILFSIKLLILLSKQTSLFVRSLKLNFLTSSKFVIFTFPTLLIVISTAYLFFLNIIYNLPSPEVLSSRKVEASTKIYDRNGVLLYSIYKDKNRSIASFEEFPQQIILATLASEDSDFYSHKGFSIKGITRAAYKYFKNGKLTGGSTITQQLVKNAILTPEKTFARKIREFILAIGVEHKYSKNEILTMYLNEVPYGGTAYGIKEAARVYFGKELSELTIAESALLAGLTKSPTSYSPFSGNPEIAKQRQLEVLSLMKDNGFITQEQLEKESNRQIVYKSNSIDIKAPHFVMYIKDLLSKSYNLEDVSTLGYSVTTTLDSRLQNLLEQNIESEMKRLAGLHVTNASGLILNVKTGEILAMVGSQDYFDEKNQGNVNVVLMPRPPGSSIKPINYAYALSHGYTPSTIIDDSPISFHLTGASDYIPKNYDGKFRGKITLRSALAESRNIPAVKILNSYGVDNMIELGKKLGITTWQDRSRFGLSLTLGGGEVKLIDLAQAYQTFANYGEKVTLNSIKEITDTKGKDIFLSDCPEKCSTQILSKEVSYLITDILKDNNARTPAFGAYSTLVIKDHPEVAVKTGTSNDLRDNLTVGYNQDYLVAVWVGNNDNSPMSRVASGVTGASSIWNHVMTSLLATKQSVAWNLPSNVSKHLICSGEKRTEDLFIDGTFKETCKTENTADNTTANNLIKTKNKKENHSIN